VINKWTGEIIEPGAIGQEEAWDLAKRIAFISKRKSRKEASNDHAQRS
jgi:hypothetical protein